jgi:hypothetical protein
VTLRVLVIHAIDCNGNPHIAAVNAKRPIFYQYWEEGLSKAERREAEGVSLSPGAVELN